MILWSAIWVLLPSKLNKYATVTEIHQSGGDIRLLAETEDDAGQAQGAAVGGTDLYNNQ